MFDVVQDAKQKAQNLLDQHTLQQYEYNARGRITAVSFADGVKEGYGYPPAGQVSRTTDGNGNTVQYRYNSFGKVSERTDQMGYAEIF